MKVPTSTQKKSRDIVREIRNYQENIGLKGKLFSESRVSIVPLNSNQADVKYPMMFCHRMPGGLQLKLSPNRKKLTFGIR